MLAALQADFGRWLQSECPDAATRLGGELKYGEWVRIRIDYTQR